MMMASSSKIILLWVLVSCSVFSFVASTEFEVGGEDGWVVPKSKSDADMYNEWASENRFKVSDTVRFKYKKDSVVVVTEEEYKMCRSSHPAFFSNNGDSVFELDRSGLFYFISGVAGHCEKGLRMIIKVLETDTPPQNQTTDSPPPPMKNGAVKMVGFGYATAAVVLIMSVFGLV